MVRSAHHPEPSKRTNFKVQMFKTSPHPNPLPRGEREKGNSKEKERKKIIDHWKYCKNTIAEIAGYSKVESKLRESFLNKMEGMMERGLLTKAGILELTDSVGRAL